MSHLNSQEPCYWATYNSQSFLIPQRSLHDSKETLTPCYLVTHSANKRKIKICKVIRINKLDLTVNFTKGIYMDIIDEDETKLEIIDTNQLLKMIG